MPRKEIQIAAQHDATGIPANARQSGTMTIAGNASGLGANVEAGTGFGAGNVNMGGSGAGSSPRVPFDKRRQRASLIKASKQYAAQSAELDETPETFDKDKYYRVQLTQSVQDHGGNWLRPADDVMILGSFAEEIAEYISGATEI